MSGVVQKSLWEAAAVSCSASPPPGAPLGPASSRQDAPVPREVSFCLTARPRSVPTAIGWKMWTVVFSVSRGGGRRGGGGGVMEVGCVVRGGFRGSKHDGVSLPPFLLPLLLFHLASPPYHTNRRSMASAVLQADSPSSSNLPISAPETGAVKYLIYSSAALKVIVHPKMTMNSLDSPSWRDGHKTLL